MNRILSYAIFPLMAMPLMPNRALAWSSGSPLPNTHYSIASDALNIISGAEYPDIAAARNYLLNGSSSEAAHGSDQKYNGGNVRDWWRDHVLTSYKSYDFYSTYFHIGEIGHLTMDQAVPTHAANILHYFLSNWHADEFEYYASFHYHCNPSDGYSYPRPFNYYQPLQDDTRSKLVGWTKPSTGGHYWLSAVNAPPMGQDVTAPGEPWGNYGGSGNTDIYTDDIFNNVTESPEIVVDQLTQAVKNAAGVFEAASRSLPPLVKDLVIEPSAQATPVINTQTGNQISFKILENRKRTVKVVITVDTGDPIISADYGTGKAFDLSAGANLPWEGTYSVTWNGILANGLYPAEGVHSLYGKKSA